jgi:crotonobetainyl-CoA:carnitine CoA-transferase CaiB-like acyl-CoA transferase
MATIAKANRSSWQAPVEGAAGDGPLAGIRVLDASTLYAGPIAAMLLGDYGADVLKLEHPSGDPSRTHGPSKHGHGLWWKVIGRNKRTATLLLSSPEGRQLMERLVADADVLVENFRPEVLERWGLGPERLLELNPNLVILRVTGFGQTGPYASRRAFGTLVEAMSGFAHQTGEADGPPTLPTSGLADGIAGIMGAYAVMLALYHRDAGGGTGQVIDLSLLRPLLTVLGPGPSVYDQLGLIPTRHGNRSSASAPRNIYATREGRWVALSAGSPSIAARVMVLVGRPDIAEQEWFASSAERLRHATELDEVVGAWIGARALDEVLTTFEEAGAAIAPVYDVQQLVDDPHVRETETLTTVEDEDLGSLLMQNLAVGLLGTPGRIRFPGRRLGQDTEQVYAERLGLDAEQVAQLRELGAV